MFYSSKLEERFFMRYVKCNICDRVVGKNYIFNRYTNQYSGNLNFSTLNVNADTNNSEKFVELRHENITVKSTIKHNVIDITDDSSIASANVLSQKEFLDTKKTKFISAKDYDNLKPHDIKKTLTAAQTEYHTSKRRKRASNIKAEEHNKVRFPMNTHTTDIKSLTSDDITNRSSNNGVRFQNKDIYFLSGVEFYGKFFKDRERNLDAFKTQLKNEESVLTSHLNEINTGHRLRISPKKYWFKSDYTSPTVEEIHNLNSFKLKFVMMNEARQALIDGDIKDELWDTFMDKILVFSEKVYIRTLLRYLQILSLIKYCSASKLMRVLDVIHSRRSEMKPKHYVFLFQALARLRLRDQRLNDNLYEMLLCWPILRNNFIIKASNSIAKLGILNSALIRPLQNVIAKRINTFTGPECSRVKSIAVIELFTDDMIVEFISRCQYYRNHFRCYTRHLQILELYLRLLKNDIYSRLDEPCRQFLMAIRQMDTLKMDNCEKLNVQYSSKEHEDISRILSLLGISHQNSLAAGPFVLDIYQPTSNTVIEINSTYQYYVNSTQLTSVAKRRHEMITAMGFRLLHVPYRWWKRLETDDNKKESLKKLLVYL